MRLHKSRLALQRQLSIISSQLPAAYDELRRRFATLGGESPSVPPPIGGAAASVAEQAGNFLRLFTG